MACSRLVTMLYLDIQKGEEARKESKFQQEIIGTEFCMKRQTMDKKVVSN